MARQPSKKALGPATPGTRVTDTKRVIPGNEEKPVAGSEARSAPGMPAPESIIGETAFTSPKGFKYRIIHTNEVDASDVCNPRESQPKRKHTRRNIKKG
jgi:hypothetical protein